MLNITQRTIIDRILKEKNHFIDFIVGKIKNSELKSYQDYYDYRDRNYYGEDTIGIDPTDYILNDETLKKMYNQVKEAFSRVNSVDYLKGMLAEKKRMIMANKTSIDVNRVYAEIEELEKYIRKLIREDKIRRFSDSDNYDKSLLAVMNYILEENNIISLIDDDNHDYDKDIIDYNKEKKKNPKRIDDLEEANKDELSITMYDMIVVANYFLINKKLDNRDINQLISYINSRIDMYSFNDPDFLSEYNSLIDNLEVRIGHISHKLFESAIKEKINREKDGIDYLEYLDNKNKILALKKNEIQRQKHLVMGTIPLTKNLVLNVQVDKKITRKERKRLALNKSNSEIEKKVVSEEVEKCKLILDEITRKIMDKRTTYEEIEDCKMYLLCMDTNKDPAVKRKVYRLLGKLNVRIHSYDKEIAKITKQMNNLSEWSQEVSSYNHLETNVEAILKREMACYSDSICILKKIFEDQQREYLDKFTVYNKYQAAKHNYVSMVSLANNYNYSAPISKPITDCSNKDESIAEDHSTYLLKNELKRNGLLYYEKNNLNEIKDVFVVDNSTFKFSSTSRSSDSIVRSPIAISFGETEKGKTFSVYIINSAPFITPETAEYLERMYLLSLNDKNVLRKKEYLDLAKQFYFDDNCVRPAIEYRFTLDEKEYISIGDFSIEQCDVKTRNIQETEKDRLRDLYLHYRLNEGVLLESCLDNLVFCSFYRFYLKEDDLPILCCSRFYEHETNNSQSQSKAAALKRAEQELVGKIGEPFLDMPKEQAKEIVKNYYANKMKKQFRTKDYCAYDDEGYYNIYKSNILNPYIFTNYFNQLVINSFIFNNQEIGKQKYFKKKQEQYAEKFNVAMGVVDCDTQIRLIKEVLSEDKQYKNRF